MDPLPSFPCSPTGLLAVPHGKLLAHKSGEPCPLLIRKDRQAQNFLDAQTRLRLSVSIIQNACNMARVYEGVSLLAKRSFVLKA